MRQGAGRCPRDEEVAEESGNEPESVESDPSTVEEPGSDLETEANDSTWH